MADAWPKGHLSQWQQVVDTARHQGDDRFDFKLEPEVHTDKEMIKILPCQTCKRPMVVTTFYVLAWAKCRTCKGEGDAHRPAGSVDVAQSGRTEPRLVKDLTKVLVNPNFARALCPVHPDDEAHEMELKSVSWSDNYGPHEWRKVDGRMVPVQISQGETVMHQCKKCNAVVTYTTTAVTQFRRVNEPETSHKHSNGWVRHLGARDDTLEAWIDKVDDIQVEEVEEDAPVEA